MSMPQQNEKEIGLSQNASITSVITNYLILVASHRGLKGTCPFHDDHAQSLRVNPEKNIFKCFGCGKEGGPVEFISLFTSFTRIEA
jgi:DNA primase